MPARKTPTLPRVEAIKHDECSGYTSGVGRVLGRQCKLNVDVDPRRSAVYLFRHIRPVAVRPLTHPERWPTPRGFLFLSPERGDACLNRWGEP